METPAQLSSLATVQPMPVIKGISSPSTKKQSSLVQQIPKHNVLIIGRDINAQIGKDENNKVCIQKLPNRNGEYLTDFSH